MVVMQFFTTDQDAPGHQVGRRIAALEAALGVALFDKRQAGYALTPIGQSMLETASTIGDAAQMFEDAAAAHSRELG